MKKLLDISLLSSLILVLFSCDPVEPEYRYEYYFDDIYTVNKHTVSPEFSDSVIRINNMDKYPYRTGDRVHMTLRYYFDISTMKMPLWEISHVTRKIETLPLTAPAGIDSAEYGAVFNKLHNYELASRYVNPVWIWKNRQNINISYFGYIVFKSFSDCYFVGIGYFFVVGCDCCFCWSITVIDNGIRVFLNKIKCIG